MCCLDTEYKKKKRGGKSGLTQKSRLDDCTDNEESLGG